VAESQKNKARKAETMSEQDEDPRQLDLEDDFLGGRVNPPAPDAPPATPAPAAPKPRKRSPKAKAAPKQPTRAHLKLIEAAVEIGQDQPGDQDAAYMARELVQCTLPHKNPGNVEVWTRTNGNLTLAMQPGYDIQGRKSYGYPYGTIPRLLLFWITTEAVRTQNPRLELGNSLSEFMHELGLNPYTGRGKRGDATRLREQMERLFQARISFHRHMETGSRQGHAWLNMEVAPRGELWWDMRSPDQTALWGSWIKLGDDFFRAITAAPVPVDIRALRALKRSPLALDLYAWLTHEAYRAHKSGKGRFVAWPLLMEQLGTDYSSPKDFGKKARAALNKVQLVYPLLKLGSLRAGVRIEPESFPAIQPKPRQTIDLRPSRD
jgi:hypothetical protein